MNDASYEGPAKTIVGILGGMGPSATADFMAKLVARTPAAMEFEHLPLAIWSNPEIPDRTRALLGLGPSPVPSMVDGVRRLIAMGARSIAIPCNTAHAFLPEIRQLVDVPFIDMIRATVDAIVCEYVGVRSVGLLATEGTRRAGLYAAECERRGLTLVNLDPGEQGAWVSPAIHMVKTGGDLAVARLGIRKAAQRLHQLGADIVVAGCTEIPLVSQDATQIVSIVDATDCLASAVVLQSVGHVC
ncbi:aspartate/glutamate racemase family protein [Streptacidiphilus jiangxiensis]|uniref:Aspartate racemase n=1 Tax=Streptacidiphilus jiangxiensis TaxID=235985 RepID=A0A1H7X936_STRJI|nr:amino acid racemase [Streptacidiphilus jiangxiensis]SEM29648.1 aspartate racemase [Streptacidiphilus jiangxiensis]